MGLIWNFAESLIDNVIRDKVTPVKGSILYCELAFSSAEHSGVYIGNNEIAHLNGSGQVEVVSPNEFMGRLGGFNSAMSIYVSCNDCNSTGANYIYKNAKSMIGKRRDYNILLDNCHQFCSGCITGDFNNSDNFWWMLKSTAEERISANSWRVWDI